MGNYVPKHFRFKYSFFKTILTICFYIPIPIVKSKNSQINVIWNYITQLGNYQITNKIQIQKFNVPNKDVWNFIFLVIVFYLDIVICYSIQYSPDKIKFRANNQRRFSRILSTSLFNCLTASSRLMRPKITFSRCS